MWFKVIYLLLFFIYFLSFKSFSQERKIEKKVYSNFREGKLDVALTELDNLYDKYNMKSFFYYWKAYIYMVKLSELKKFDNTIINRDSASYYIEKSLSFLSDAPLYLISEDLNIDKIEFDILFPGCNVNPPIGEKKYTNCLSLIKNDFKLKKEAINELKYNLLLSEKIEDFKTGNKDINSFLKEIKPRVKLVPAKNPLFGEVAKSSYMELANIRNQRELFQLQKELTDKNWINYIKTYKDEEYLSIVPELEKLINKFYFNNLENQYQKIKNNVFDLRTYLANLEGNKNLIETNALKYINSKYGEIILSNTFMELRKENYYKIINEATIKLKELIEIQEKLERQKKFENEFEYEKKVEENFEKNTNGLFEIETEYVTNKIEGGKYVIENKTNKNGVCVSLTKEKLPAYNESFIFSIDTKWIKGVDSNSYEIVWGSNDFSNKYVLGITSNGCYSIGQYKNGENIVFYPFKSNGFINKSGSNTIGLRQDGGKVDFFVNYYKIHELEYVDFEGDQIGVVVNGAQRVEFDNLKFAYKESQGRGGPDMSDEEWAVYLEEERKAAEQDSLKKLKLRKSEAIKKVNVEIKNGYGPVIKDINGNIYKTVYIGTQHWMAENLKVNKYNDGTVIPNIIPKGEREWHSDGAWCYYDNKQVNNSKYGKLYNWWVVNNTKNVCPIGWHVPSSNDWHTLIDYLGGPKEVIENHGSYTITHSYLDDNTAGKMKSTNYWKNPNEGANNASLFTALPGGSLTSGSSVGEYNSVSGSFSSGSSSYFSGITYSGLWWSSDEENVFKDHSPCMNIDYNFTFTIFTSCNKSDGNSIRCVKD